MDLSLTLQLDFVPFAVRCRTLVWSHAHFVKTRWSLMGNGSYREDHLRREKFNSFTVRGRLLTRELRSLTRGLSPTRRVVA